MKLEGKIAVLTGAASGIGEATARLFAAEGATTVLVDVDAAGLRRCASEMGRDREEPLTLTVDVSKSSEVAGLFAEVRSRYGRLDVLFNNAGIAANGTVVTTDEDLWDRILAVTLKSVYLCCREGIPLMRDGGSIINTASSWAPIAA